jgi:protein ImuA
MVTLTTAGKGLLGGADRALGHAGDLLARERARPVVATGFRPLDALLPAGGVRPGSLVEWLSEGDAGGGGAASLAVAVACRLAAASGGEASEQVRPRTIVVVDRTGWFHPPAVLPWLGDGRRLVVARPARDDDEIWTIDQALRCTGVAAVVAWPRARVLAGPRALTRRSAQVRGARSAASTQQWSVAMRRWQLAAASSGAVGLFVRPRTALGEPSWAEVRIAVMPQAGGTLTERRLRLVLAGGSWEAAVGDGQRTADVVLDVARGTAAVLRSGSAGHWPAAGVNAASMPIPPVPAAAGDPIRERSGVACRAS